MNSRAPSLHGSCPASSLLRTRPPPSRLQPLSRGMPVIRPTLLRRFLDGTRTASPVAQRILVTVLPLPPRRSESTRRSGFVDPCCLRSNTESSTSGVHFVSGPPVGSLALRPGDSLTIPKMALSVGFRSFGFPPVCDSSYRAPDSCPGGTRSRWMRQPSLDALCPQNRSNVSQCHHREVLGSLLPCISAVKPSDSRQPDNSRARSWANFSCSAVWRILDARVDPIRVVVADVVSD